MWLSTSACRLTFSAAACQAVPLLLPALAADDSSWFPALAAGDTPFLADAGVADLRQNGEEEGEEGEMGLCVAGL